MLPYEVTKGAQRGELTVREVVGEGRENHSAALRITTECSARRLVRTFIGRSHSAASCLCARREVDASPLPRDDLAMSWVPLRPLSISSWT